MGATHAARPYLDSALELLDAAPANDFTTRIMRASVLTNLGLIEGDESEFANAIQHQQQALELLQDPMHSYPIGVAQAEENLGIAWFGSGKFDEAETSWQQALEIQRATGNIARQNALLLMLGDVLLVKRDATAALVRFRDALTIAQNSKSLDSEAMASFGMSQAYWQTGDREASSAAFSKAIDQWKLLEAPERLAMAFSRRANLVSGLVPIEDEIALRNMAADAWHAAGDDAAAGGEFLKSFRAAVNADRDDVLTEPLAKLDRASAIPELHLEALFAKSICLERSHNLVAALAAIEEASAISEDHAGDDSARFDFLKARILEALGRTSESEDTLRTGLLKIDQLPSDSDRGELWYIAGRGAQRAEKIADAINCFLHALECFDRSRDSLRSFDCRLALADLYTRGGNAREALLHGAEAARYARSHETPKALRIELNLGFALANAGRLDDAATQLRATSRLAEERGAPSEVLEAEATLFDVLLRQEKWRQAEESLCRLKEWAKRQPESDAEEVVVLGVALLRLRRGRPVSEQDRQRLLRLRRMRTRSERAHKVLASDDLAEKAEDLADLLRGALLDLEDGDRSEIGDLPNLLFNRLQSEIWRQDISRHLGWRRPVAKLGTGMRSPQPAGPPNRDRSDSDLKAVEELIADYRAAGVWEDPNLAIIRPAIDLASMGSRFEGRVLVNAPSLTPGCLHFYFYRSDPNGLLSSFLNTCAYISSGDVILCSLPFLERLMTYVTLGKQSLGKFAPIIEKDRRDSDSQFSGFYNEPLDAMIMAGFAQFLVEWVIAHEVAHAELGHKSTFIGSEPISGADEQAADDYYADRILGELHATEAATSLANVLMRAFRECYENEYGGDYRGPGLATLNAVLHLPPEFGPHPHFLVRLLNLADRILLRYPDVDRSGYYDKVRRNIISDGGAA